MKFNAIKNWIVRVLVVVLGTCQTAVAAEGVLDFSVPSSDSEISVPVRENAKAESEASVPASISSMSASELFATALSPGSIAVGVAEGNLTVSGKATALYWGHTDPGNHVTNRGFCSWNRAADMSVKEADRRCLAALKRQSASVERKLRSLKIDPEIHLEALVNGTDVWNQSPGAGADFPAKYKEALDKGMRDEKAFLYARVEAFRTPSGVLSASGLFGICTREVYYQQKLARLKPYSEAWRWQCIALDQGRRVEAVRKALKQNAKSVVSPSGARIETVAFSAKNDLPENSSEPALKERSPIVLSFEIVEKSSSILDVSEKTTKGEAIAKAQATSIPTVWEGNAVKFAKESFLAISPKRGEKIGYYSVGSPFGRRPQPCTVCSSYHNGVDVGTPMGTPLFAIALPAHTINVECHSTRLGGLTAIIKSESVPDRQFAAVHLSTCFAGTHKAGAIFALTGNSGQATTGPHLHWTEIVNNNAVPPQRGYVEWAVTGKIPQEFTTQLTSNISAAPTQYGHFAYREAPQNDLVNVGNGQKLRRAAAAKFREMVAAAAQQRISLVPLSGFRSIHAQSRIFYGVAAERGQSLAERAKVSAPPGYSEHHTGYAIDIGYGYAPERNLSLFFENTPAFRWLLANAETYGFELSFPRNNPQGVAYEPWHWRFVGDADSQETFNASRRNKPFLFKASSTS